MKSTIALFILAASLFVVCNANPTSDLAILNTVIFSAPFPQRSQVGMKMVNTTCVQVACGNTNADDLFVRDVFCMSVQNGIKGRGDFVGLCHTNTGLVDTNLTNLFLANSADLSSFLVYLELNFLDSGNVFTSDKQSEFDVERCVFNLTIPQMFDLSYSFANVSIHIMGSQFLGSVQSAPYANILSLHNSRLQIQNTPRRAGLSATKAAALLLGTKTDLPAGC